MTPIYILIPTIPGRGKETSRCIQSIQENTDYPYILVIYRDNFTGWVNAIHTMLEGINGYCVLLGCDVTVTKGWLKELAAGYFATFPEGDGIAVPWDDLNKGMLAQHPLGHSRVLKKYIHRGYVHNFSDDELTIQMKKIDKMVVVPDSVIIHWHHRNNRAVKDKGYFFIEQNHKRDRELFMQRANQGFPL